MKARSGGVLVWTALVAVSCGGNGAGPGSDAAVDAAPSSDAAVDGGTDAGPAPVLASFAFTVANNPSLVVDVAGAITASGVAVTLPVGTATDHLIATFDAGGARVDVAGADQTSGVTANDFTTPVPYTLVGSDGAMAVYAVAVTADSTATCGGQLSLEGAPAQLGAAFGTAVAVSADGTTLVVGAPNDASAAIGIDGDSTDTSSPQSGAAYVFVRSGAAWTRQAYLKASNTGSNDQFGWAVAISADGNTVGVGARNESSTGSDQTNDASPYAGAVYVFSRTGAAWAQDAYLKSSNVQAGGRFGSTVAVAGDGSTLAVGEPNSFSLGGTAQVFTRGGATWSRVSTLVGNAVDGELFLGQAIALSGTGADFVVGYSGGAYVFTSADHWTHPVAAFPQEVDSAAISTAGDVIVLGTAGVSASMYAGSGSAWTLEATVTATDGSNADGYAASVGLSGDGSVAVVGAPSDASAAVCTGGAPSDDAGAVYRYRRSTSWALSAFLKSARAGSNLSFGTAEAVSSDGSVLVVGAPGSASGEAIVIE